MWDPSCQSWIRLFSGNLPEPWTAVLPDHTMGSVLWGAAQAAPLAGHQARPLQGRWTHSKAEPELSSVCGIKSDLGKRRQDDRLTPDFQELSVCVHARASVGTHKVVEGLYLSDRPG